MPEWKVQISNSLADFRWLVHAEEAAFSLSLSLSTHTAASAGILLIFVDIHY